MEYIQEFAVIQGCLITLQKKIGCLQMLNRDNEVDREKIGVITENVLKSLNTFENLDDVKLRQIGLFILLNSDLELKKYLVEDPFCGHLVDSSPTLSKDAIIDLMCQPVLLDCFFELIVFSPSCLSNELVEIACRYLEKSSEASIPPCTSLIVKALYCKLMALDKNKNIHDCAIDCAAIRLMSYFSKLLEMYGDSKLLKANNLNNKLSEGYAILLRSSLDLVTCCLSYYINPCFPIEEILNIYKMNIKFDYTLWHQDSKIYWFDNVHDQLLSILVVGVAQVTVDVWLDWAELDSPFVLNYSFQKDIAECMYRCHETILAIEGKGISSDLMKGLIPMLASMGCKPRDEDDEIEDADINLFLQKIQDKSCNQKKWLLSFLKKFDTLDHEECLELINTNLNLIDLEIVNIFLTNILSSIEKHGSAKEISEQLKKTFISSVGQLCINDQLHVLKAYLYQTNSYNLFFCQDYNENVIKPFNTVIDGVNVSHDKMYGEFINLSFQNPLDVISRLFKYAISSDFQAQILGDILVKIHPFHCIPSNSPNMPSIFLQMLLENMQAHTHCEFKDSSFTCLITLLISNEAISASEFLKLCLFPLIHTSLVAEDWNSLHLWLIIVQIFLDGTISFHDLHLVCGVLLLLAQILEKCRQNYASFSSLCMLVNEKALCLIPQANEMFLTSQREGCSVSTCVKNNLMQLSSPMNLLYFSELWSENECVPKVAVDWKVYLIHGVNLDKWNIHSSLTCSFNFPRRTLVYELIELLPSSPQSEWKSITQNIFSIVSPSSMCTSPSFVMELFIDVIKIIVLMKSSTKTSEQDRDNTLSCIDYCVRNFCVVMKEEIVGQLHILSASEAGAIFQKVIYLYSILPEVIQESCEGLVLNILVHLIACTNLDMEVLCVPEDDDESQSIKSQCLEVVKKMTVSLSILQDEKIRQMLALRLQEGFDSVVR